MIRGMVQVVNFDCACCWIAGGDPLPISRKRGIRERSTPDILARTERDSLAPRGASAFDCPEGQSRSSTGDQSAPVPGKESGPAILDGLEKQLITASRRKQTKSILVPGRQQIPIRTYVDRPGASPIAR